MVDAKKVPLPAPKAISLARECDFLISGRGVKWKKTKLSELNDEDLGKILLGRSGNLKAPTIRDGSHLFVGWCEVAWLENLP